MKVAITGMGIISAIGKTVEDNYNALVTGQKGISTIENFYTIKQHKI